MPRLQTKLRTSQGTTGGLAKKLRVSRATAEWRARPVTAAAGGPGTTALAASASSGLGVGRGGPEKSLVRHDPLRPNL